MKMKLSFLLVIMFSLLLVGCGGTNSNGVTVTTTANSEGNTGSNTEQVDWPKKPIQLYIPAKAGGGTDIKVRVIAKYLQEELGQPIVIVNQDSGGGAVAFESVRTAKPDGYTLLAFHNGMQVLYHTGVYDHTYEEFTTVADLSFITSQAYIADNKSGLKDINDLVEKAKANPGKLTFGIQTGGLSHLIFGLFEKETNVDMKELEAGTEVDKLAAIKGGFIDVAIVSSAQAKQYEASGDVTVLGLVDEERDSAFPDIVPVVEQGYPDLGFSANLVLYGPKGMDTAIVGKINEALKKMESDEATIQALKNINSYYEYKDVEESFNYVREQHEMIGNLTKELGLSKR